MPSPVGGDRVKQTAEAEHIGPDYTGDNISAKKVANYVWNPTGLDINNEPNGAWERKTQSDTAVVNAIENITIPAPTGGATEGYQETQTDVLEEIRSALQALASAKGIAPDIRVTLLGGTTAVTTVTTVGTVTGITNIDGLPARSLIASTNNTNAVLSNINNIV